MGLERMAFEQKKGALRALLYCVYEACARLNGCAEGNSAPPGASSAHRLSLAGCSPAVPASVSPLGLQRMLDKIAIRF